ncbi:hypothetical protein B0H14DRAFT_2899212 [Mycena olivaceomarginata]|nr:hypothetical protein B0H14DRAFT_2899212 [Mycena olivaceomarginata]
MAVCAGPGVSRVCRRTSPEDGRTARVGHRGDLAGGYRSPLVLGMTLGVRIVIYGGRTSVERKDVSTCTETAIRGFWSERTTVGKSIRWRRGGVIHASPLVAPVLLADLLRLRMTRTEGVSADAGLSNYEKRLPAAVVDDDLMDVRKPNGT